jgi:hypothetical protein
MGIPAAADAGPNLLKISESAFASGCRRRARDRAAFCGLLHAPAPNPLAVGFTIGDGDTVKPHKREIGIETASVSTLIRMLAGMMVLGALFAVLDRGPPPAPSRAPT